ncbi:MAG: alpha/beta fold hydrolase [Parvibaculales bacterium]
MLSTILIIIVLIGLGLWAHDAYARGRLLDNLPPAGDFIETDKAVLHYLSANTAPDADKPVFVLIHGSSANAHDMMLALGDGLAEIGTVLAFDRPGIGRSRNKVPHIQMADPRAQAREIHKAVKQLGYANPYIIGQSWGGSTALAYAQVHGEEIAGTIMLAPPIVPWYGPDFWAYRLVTTPIIGPAFAHMVLGKYGSTQLQPGAEGAAHPEVTPDNYVYDTALALILQPHVFIANATYAINLKHNLADMQRTRGDMPGTFERLMIIHGDKDPTVSIKWNALPFISARPDVELIELKGAGHLLHHTWKQEIIDQIARFMRDGKVRPGHHKLEKQG